MKEKKINELEVKDNDKLSDKELENVAGGAVLNENIPHCSSDGILSVKPIYPVVKTEKDDEDDINPKGVNCAR